MRVVTRCAVTMLAAATIFSVPCPAQPSTVLVSTTASGEQIRNPATSDVSISRNGRYAVFTSAANNIVAKDTNIYPDVFVRDLETGVVDCISEANDTETPIGGQSGLISNDGRYAVFLTKTLDVDGNPRAGTVLGVFMRDLTAHTTTAITKSLGGILRDADRRVSMSADGRYVAFLSSAEDLVPNDVAASWDIFVYDRTTATVVRATPPVSAYVSPPSISSDGQWVVFSTRGSTLVGGDTNNAEDVFLLNLQTHVIQRVSVADDGSQANSGSYTTATSGYAGGTVVSDDGKFVVFTSYATNLVSGSGASVPVYLRDVEAGHTYVLSHTPTGVSVYALQPSISPDGRFIVFVSNSADILPNGDTNVAPAYLLDRNTSTLRRVSVTVDGAPAWALSPWVSADGSRVAFLSDDADLTTDDANTARDAYVTDVDSGQISRVSSAPDHVERGGATCQGVEITGDGRYVFYWSDALNLPYQGLRRSGTYRRDRLTGSVKFVSALKTIGASDDGRLVGVTGERTLIEPAGGDANDYIWVVDVETGVHTLASVRSNGSAWPVDNMAGAAMSRDGNSVVFTPMPVSQQNQDRYRRDLQTGEIALVSVGQDRNLDTFDVQQIPPAVSADGRYIAYYRTDKVIGTDATRYKRFVCLKDMLTGTLTDVALVSELSPVGSTYSAPDNLSLSADGRFLAFSSNMTGIVPDDTSGRPDAFFSGTDVFVYDRVTGATSRVSVASDGTEANDFCGFPSISNDGRSVAFISSATNLASGATARTAQVYVHDRQTNDTAIASLSSQGTAGTEWSGAMIETNGASLLLASGPIYSYACTNGGNKSLSGIMRPKIAMSGDGQWAAFLSPSSDLVPNDTDGAIDVFVRGPMRAPSGITMGTVAKALRAYAGLSALDDVGALNVVATGASATCIDMLDIVALCRGMDPVIWPS